MNKIWNAARFALTNLEDFKVPADGIKALPKAADMSVFDQWIIYKLQEVEKTVDQALEKNNFSEASMALYHFIWGQFCDWYIEFSKQILGGSTSREREATQLVMAQVLNRIMRLLHPFCPFITEEIYQKLPIKGPACIIDQYPTIRNDRGFLSLGSERANLEVDAVKEVITAIRNIRGENRLSPAIKIKVRLGVKDTDTKKILENNQAAIMTLGRIEDLNIGDEGNLSKCAVTNVNVHNLTVKVIIPLEGLVDFDEEIKRIHKTIEKMEKDINLLSGKLSNEKFVANADEDIVAADRILLEQSKQQLTSLQEALTRFQN